MDDGRRIGDLLHAHGLKKTAIRTEMLHLFMNHDFALSASDIIARMKAGHDRVTIYRALASFEKHNILHKASEDGQAVKYALCSRSRPDETHDYQHAHFTCDECHKTYCLQEVIIPKIEVSNEFLVDRISFTLHGICKECKAQP